MANVYKMILDEADRRQITYASNYFPYYISSMGCHVFNMNNRKKEIYTEGNIIPNTRLHILMVAFPGFGKTFFLKQFLDDDRYSMLRKTSIKGEFKSGKMTEAGFVGSFAKNAEGVVTEKHGLCHPTKDGESILGVEEFSAVTNSLKQDYNVGLDTAILTALDSGRVGKDMADGNISYHTDLTLWAGVQPARYDLSSGFSRRFIFMTFYPTIKDIELYRDKRRRAKGIKTDYTALKNIRLAIGQRKKEIEENLTHITFSQEFYSHLNTFDHMHYDDELCERLALGYWLMRSEHIQDQLYIRLDDELKRLLNQLKVYEQTVRNTGPTTIIEKLISSEEKIQKGTVINYASRLGLGLNQIQGALNNLSVKKKIKKGDGEYEILIEKST